MRNALAAKVAGVAAVVVIVVAPGAAAHVTIDPEEAIQGRFAYLHLRVPNERENASTTEVAFNIPTDHPITEVQVEPKPGWHYEFDTTELDEPIGQDDGPPITEVVSKITWTGGAIPSTEFAVFEIVLGPLPDDVDEVQFPTVQTYDNGEEVVWDQPGGHEAEFPAPTLRLVPDEGHGAGGMAAPAAAQGSGGPTVSPATQDDVDGANALGIAGIVVGVVGIVVAGFALVRTRIVRVT